MMAYGSQEEEASKPPSYSPLPYQQSPILPKMTRLTVNRPAIRPLGRWQKWTPSNSSSHPLGYYETISLTSENDFEGQDKTGLFEDDEEGKQNISFLSSPLCEKCSLSKSVDQAKKSKLISLTINFNFYQLLHKRVKRVNRRMSMTKAL